MNRYTDSLSSGKDAATENKRAIGGIKEKVNFLRGGKESVGRADCAEKKNRPSFALLLRKARETEKKCN